VGTREANMIASKLSESLANWLAMWQTEINELVVGEAVWSFDASDKSKSLNKIHFQAKLRGDKQFAAMLLGLQGWTLKANAADMQLLSVFADRLSAHFETEFENSYADLLAKDGLDNTRHLKVAINLKDNPSTGFDFIVSEQAARKMVLPPDRSGQLKLLTAQAIPPSQISPSLFSIEVGNVMLPNEELETIRVGDVVLLDRRLSELFLVKSDGASKMKMLIRLYEKSGKFAAKI
jgi:hypothetical protein